jgi:hypothetical protein
MTYLVHFVLQVRLQDGFVKACKSNTNEEKAKTQNLLHRQCLQGFGKCLQNIIYQSELLIDDNF